MRLENDTLIIESRREISDLQEMIEIYLKEGKPNCLTPEELKDINDKLDVLYMCW